LVFLSVILTLGLWAPLSSDAMRGPNSAVITENYFGVFRCMTLRSEMKEPNYSMNLTVSPPRLAVTLFATAGLWGFVVWKLRQTRPRSPGVGADRPNP